MKKNLQVSYIVGPGGAPFPVLSEKQPEPVSPPRSRLRYGFDREGNFRDMDAPVKVPKPAKSVAEYLTVETMPGSMGMMHVSRTKRLMRDMTLTACVGSEEVDRAGDIVKVAGIDTTAFMKNPVVLFSHDYSSPPIGKCLKLWVDGKQLMASIMFADSERGREVAALYGSDMMSAFSIGFRPLEWKPRKGGLLIERSELLELSCVPVPAQPAAVAARGLDVAQALPVHRVEVAQFAHDVIRDPSRRHIEGLRDALKEYVASRPHLGPWPEPKAVR
jgi:HK97 family phage prohead protease